MPGPWFRIAYAHNALARLLAERDQRLDALTLAEGIRAMVDFSQGHRPQHAQVDALEVRWGAADDRFEFVILRRMQRAHQPESPLSLVFEFALTPGRMISGSAPVASVRDVTATEGYRAVARAAILGRRID